MLAIILTIIMIILIIIIIVCLSCLSCSLCYEYMDNVKIKNIQKNHTICIMAIFKNEQDYLEEWINHHKNQGISQIYLYINDSDINKYPYINNYKDFITLIDWTKKENEKFNHTIQRQAYEHCVQNYSHLYQYIMMLDIDEFLVPTNNKKVLDIIIQYDKNNTKALKIPRFNYGSDGHIAKPVGDVVKNYFTCEKICSSYKTIANSNFIDTNAMFYGVHDFPFLNKKGKIYNDFFSYKYTGYPNGCRDIDVNQVPLIINHYYTKSYDEFMKRCNMWKNGGINPIGYRRECEKTFKNNNFV